MKVAGVILAVLLVGFSVTAAEKLSERLPVHDGETCVMCGREVPKTGAAYRAGGQRVAVCQQCEPKFRMDPDGHMAALRPSNMIFDAQTESYLGDGWIWLGIWALLGVVFGGLSAHLAVRKGTPPLRSFLLGFFFSIPGYVFVAFQPDAVVSAAPDGLRKVPLTHDPMPCPSCGNTNHPSAIACSDCGAELTAHTASEALAAREG